LLSFSLTIRSTRAYSKVAWTFPQMPFPRAGSQGVVLDPSGAPIPDMTVTDRTEGGVAVLRSTKTDSKGHFRFSAQRGKGVHCLRFDHPWFNPLQVRLKLEKNAPQRGITARPHLGG